MSQWITLSPRRPAGMLRAEDGSGTARLRDYGACLTKLLMLRSIFLFEIAKTDQTRFMQPSWTVATGSPRHATR